MRVLVTGATGCLGQATARRFASGGADVTASGRNNAVGQRLSREGLRFRPADLVDASAVDQLVRGHDVVVHCGALSSAWGPAAAFRRINVEGTRHIVVAAQRHTVRRVVFVSSSSLYFSFRHRTNITEADPLPGRAVNHYVASKRAAERIVASAHERGLGTVTVRPRAIFGPGDTALLPRLLRVAARGWLPLVDGGAALVDLTYVDNVADVLWAAAVAPDAVDGRVYNVTNGEPWRVASLLRSVAEDLRLPVQFIDVPFPVAYAAAALLELLASLTPGRPEPPLTRYTVGVLGRSQTLCIDAARRDLAYAPRVSVAEGVRRTVDWWRRSHA
jgi:nucleoside-diphosphate-sugar epimerase